MYSWFTMIYLLKMVILHSCLSLSNEYYCFLSCMISISSSFIMEFACDPHAVCLSSKTGRGPKHCFWMSQIPEELISMQPPFPNEPQCKKLAYHIQKIRINFPQWVLNPYPKIQNRSSPWYYNYILSSWHSPMMSYGDGSSYLWPHAFLSGHFCIQPTQLF